MFNIDKNIPLPTETQDAEKYPFDHMEIGDSFVASTDFKSFDDIIESVKERNEDGDRRFFYWVATRDHESGLNMLRVWRIAFAYYINHQAPDDAPVIECMLSLLKNGPMSHTKLTTFNLSITVGSLADRKRILSKYAFLFKTKTGATGGLIYEIA